MSNYTDETANNLADLALAEAEASGDAKIVDQIGDILGASSQSLQESYLTAVRVRRAERRARELLAETAKARGATPPVIEKEHPKDTPPPETAPKEAEKPNRKGW